MEQDNTPATPPEQPNQLPGALPSTGGESVPDGMIEETAQTEPSPPPVELTPNKNNAEQLYEDVSIFDKGLEGVNQNEEIIPVMSATRENLTRLTDNNKGAERDDTAAAARWKAILTDALGTIPLGGQFEDTVERDTAQYKQFMQTEKGQVGYAAPRLAEKGGGRLTGEKAVLRVRSLMGHGGLISVPLFHSGFWITIKTPGDSAYIELRRRLIEDKISLGRSTHGLVFSNVQSFTNGWILDLIEDNLYETTLKDQSDLRSKIKLPDLPILFWGLACAIWPKGFQYARAVVNGDGIETKEILTGKINVGKLMWVDNAYFSAWQKSHMSNRQAGSVTQDSLDRYAKEFTLNEGRSISLSEDLAINLRVPNARDYIDSGYRWITNMVNIVDKTFTGNTDDPDRRNRAMMDHANATLMRQYGHWVQSVTVDDSEQTEQEVIDAIVDTIAEDEEARKKFFKEISRFIDDCTGALIAIPEVSAKGSAIPRFPRLIPLDVVSVFFTLLMQRVNKIMTR